MTVKSISAEQYKDAIKSALDILFYYEDDEYEFLADESVICDLTDNFGLGITDAHALLEVAQLMHQERMDNGFYS